MASRNDVAARMPIMLEKNREIEQCYEKLTKGF
jgi:hypothetical protein